MAYTDHEWPAIIGLDLGKQTYSGCRLSGEGYVKRHNFTGKMTRGDDGYACLLEKISDGDLVIMEAGSSSFNLARFLMNSTEAEIIVLNPAQLRLIWDNQRKTDKADAMKLACIGRDMRREAWPTVSVPSEDEQAERSAVSFHVFLKEDETAKFNRLFALFNSVGYPDIDKGRCKKDFEYRHALADSLLTGQAAEIARILNDGIDLVQFQIESVEQELISICLAHPHEALSWLSMPGVWLVNAATLIAYVGDGARFSKPEQLMNYAGLVPRLNQSGITDIHGKVTKMGCRCVRRNIVQGASTILTHKYNPSCPLSRFAYRKKKELIHHGKAAVAVANHMLRIGLALLHHHDIYCTAKEDNCRKLKAKLAGYKLSALSAYLPQ